MKEIKVIIQPHMLSKVLDVYGAYARVFKPFTRAFE